MKTSTKIILFILVIIGLGWLYLETTSYSSRVVFDLTQASYRPPTTESYIAPEKSEFLTKIAAEPEASPDIPIFLTRVASEIAETECKYKTNSLMGNVVEETTCKIVRAYCVYSPETNGSPTFCGELPYPDNKFALVLWGRNGIKLDGRCLIIHGVTSFYQNEAQIMFQPEDTPDVKFCD